MAQTTKGVWVERISDRWAGLLAIVLMLVVTFFVFTKAIPFKHHYEIKAVVQTSNLLVPGSQVRIAGVNVGKVVSVGRYKHSDLAEVTMRIEDDGRPIRRDAELKIRPRLFLEGAFYVDLKPGAPGAPEMPDRGVIPLARTTVPVQLDQAVSPLRADIRKGLQGFVQGLGDALGSRPTAAEDATQDPAVRGLTGAQAMNRTLASAPRALRDGAITTLAFRGQQPGDLTRLLGGFARATGALAQEEGRLTGLVRDFDTTLGVTALHASALRETIRSTARVASDGRTAFASLRDALPGTRLLVRDLARGFDELPATIDASGPWLTQAHPLLGGSELGGLLKVLAPATTSIAALTSESRRIMPRLEALSVCGTKVLIPTAKLKVDDGPLSAGVENYKELWYAMVGQASEGQSFDGNGSFLRLQAIGGQGLIHSGRTNYLGTQMISSSAVAPQRTAPAFGAKPPAIRRDVACAKNPVPDVNGPASRGPADGSRPGAAAPKPPTLISTPPAGFKP